MKWQLGALKLSLALKHVHDQVAVGLRGKIVNLPFKLLWLDRFKVNNVVDLAADQADLRHY